MKHTIIALTLLLITPFLIAVNQRTSKPASKNKHVTDLETLADTIKKLFSSISFVGGSECDWEGMAEAFMPGAILVLPTANEAVRQTQDLISFRAGFKDFVANSPAKERGFHEKIMHKTIVEYGAVAHAYVVYESRFEADSEKVLARGVDSIQLCKNKGLWRIASVASERETSKRPLLPRFLGK
ncbi:MAG: hypothetical protein GY930_06090 [bacterium]|nr:hypothetical protein [bacterium]